MAARKLAVASLPALLLIGALLLVAATPASSGAAVNEEDAASGHQFPSSLDRAPEPSPRSSRAVRAGSPAASSLVGTQPSGPASAPNKGSGAVPPQAPAPAPHPPCNSKDDEKLWLLVLILLILCCLSSDL
ncbi:unnamed protein product [Urochloa decumbens]|uniref:Uncharacterized protein n=1 Tax=Urochloa decumbens TaxID=240449 RepID=A0ABC9A7B0_9POAL